MQSVADTLEQLAADQAPARDIDRDWNRADPGHYPFLRLSTRGLQYPGVDIVDEAGLFSDRYERVRSDAATRWMIPANQRFGARQGSCLCIHFGLIHEQELATPYPDAEILFKGHSLHGGDIHRVGEDSISVLAVRLPDIQRNISVAHRIRGTSHAGRRGNSNRRGDRQTASSDDEGCAKRRPQALGNNQRSGGFRDVFQKDGELVASEARSRVTGPDARCKPL